MTLLTNYAIQRIFKSSTGDRQMTFINGQITITIRKRGHHFIVTDNSGLTSHLPIVHDGYTITKAIAHWKASGYTEAQ